MWKRLRWRWMVLSYGPELARAWIALENFERVHLRGKRYEAMRNDILRIAVYTQLRRGEKQ